MFKGLMAALIGMLFSSLAMAADPYVGLQIGWLDGSVETTYFRLPADRFQDDGAAFSGGGYSAFAGIKHGLSGSKFIAYEVSFDSASAKYQSRFSDGVDTDEQYYKRLGGAGLAFLFGREWSDFSIHSLFGIQYANFELFDSDAGKEKVDHLGVRFGVGASFNVSERVRIRADWSRVAYDKAFYQINSDLQPSESRFGVGAFWQF